MVDKNGFASELWNSPWVGVPLWVVAAYYSIHWLAILPSPGKAIGALAVVAGLMSVREIKVLGKISWVAVLICLLVTEFRAIDFDRRNAETSALNDRKQQNDGFMGVRNAQDKEFADTAKALKDALDGIKTTLTATNTTLQQTRPRATINLLQLTFINPPFNGARLVENVDYGWNSRFSNNGSEHGRMLKHLEVIYVGKPDDINAQRSLVKIVTNKWARTKEIYGPEIEFGAPVSFTTLQRTFSAEELNRINHGDTIYFLRRIEYSDSLGKWLSEDCQSNQINPDGTINFIVAHPCLIFHSNRSRQQ